MSTIRGSGIRKTGSTRYGISINCPIPGAALNAARRLTCSNRLSIRIQNDRVNDMLGKYLQKNKVLMNVTADSVEKSLMKMLQVSDENDHARLVAQILERETLMPTSLGKGIALPRVHVENKEKTEIILALSPDGLPFRSFDQQQIKIVVLFLFSKNDDAASLLAQSLRLFNDDSLRTELVNCATEEEVIATVNKWEGN